MLSAIADVFCIIFYVCKQEEDPYNILVTNSAVVFGAFETKFI
jgi:hypothetical protein